MDKRPIAHAADIARLAGESCCMEIFLRSHLNILNYRMSRVSDGSYAETARQTYVRELELIDVKVGLLLPGTLLAAGDLPGNHYRGDIKRSGRAMAELENRKAVYGQVERLIASEKLDTFNKIRLAFLLESYIYHLSENKLKKEAGYYADRFKKTLNGFPEYVSEPIEQNISAFSGK